VLPPKLDYDTASVMPSVAPTVVRTPMEGERAEIVRAPDAPAPSEPPAPDEAPASTAAAAAVATRLEAILEAEAEASPEEAVADSPPDEPAVVVVEEAPDDVVVEEAHFAPAETARSPVTAATLDLRNVPLFEAPAIRRRRGGPVPLFLLGLGGVALFIIAVSIGFRSPVPGAPPFAGGLFGWVFGGAGILCFAIAAYFLLIRLGEGGRDS
jgi:hypothetical protein